MPNTATAQQIVDQCLMELGLPTGLIGSTQQLQQVTQAVALLNTLGRDANKCHDWQFQQRVYTMTPDGVTDNFPMPSDFGRVVNQTEWAASMKRPMQGPMTAQQWGWTQYGIVSVGVYYRYRILDNLFYVFPVPGVGEVFHFYYISENWIIAADGTGKETVTSGDDVIVFDKDLIISGLKMRLWAIKGFDTTNLVQEYNYRLQAEKGQDQGAQILHLSRSGLDFHLLDVNNIPDGNWNV